MQREETLREVAALRHNLHINSRLRLEFLASISKLLRDYGISADDQLLSSLILAVPDELSAGDEAPMPPDTAPMPPTPPDEEPMPPAPPEEEPMPPTAPMPPEAP
jgi:hypothetical protein